MLRSLYILVVYFAILGLGLGMPYILTLGYLWTDIFRPNNVIYSTFRFIPVAFLMGGAAVGSYLLFDRRSPPRIGAQIILTLVFALWITLTTFWAVVPDAAWDKWDWAFKGVLFSAFIPFVIRSRNQIEGFIQVLIFSLMADLIPFAVKTAVTGGGYGRNYGLITTQTFLGQGETLAAACFMVMPLILFLMKHSTIVPKNKYTQLGYVGVIGLAVATAIGTHERTALVAMVVFAGMTWWKSRRKILFGAILAAAAAVIVVSAPDAWKERMATVSSAPTDDSARVRILVWRWTLDRMKAYPQGGGFDAYRVNQIVLPATAESDAKVETARAFHSTYFEVLGEHGWVGFSLFMALVTVAFRNLGQAAGRARNKPHLLWAVDLSSALQSSLLVILACGAVIGIGFQPFFYYLFALAFSLSEYVRRVESPVRDTDAALARPALGPAAALPIGPSVQR